MVSLGKLGTTPLHSVSLKGKRSAECGVSSAIRRSTPIGFLEQSEFCSRSHNAVIRVYDAVGNVIGTHEHKGDFKDW